MSAQLVTSRSAAVAPLLHRSPLRTPWRTASVLGIFGFTLSVLGSWIPSLWGDEVASIMSAERPWSSLFRMLGNVDAVHGTFYTLLHVWIDAFGASAASVRLPSALAVGAAAAGVVILANRLGRYRMAVMAGIIFGVLPRTTYMGSEARSYALGTACAVWLTILFVRLVSTRSRSRIAWLGYSVLFAISIYVFLYLILLAVVYAVALLACIRERSGLLRWFVFTCFGIALAAPVIFFAYNQRGQIAFRSRYPDITLSRFFVDQWFGSDLLALGAWLTIAGFVAASVVLWWRGRRRLPELDRPLIALRTTGAHHTEPSLTVLTLAWFVLPPLILFIANLFIPLYAIRYMSFVTPAIAILLALAIDAVTQRRRWLAIVAVAGILALAAPTYLEQRGPYAKDDGSDWSQVAQVIGKNAHTGDAVVFDETAKPSRRPRLAMHAYPAEFAAVTDVTVKSPYTDDPGLWDTTISIAAAAPRLAAGDGRVWLIEYRGPTKSGVVSSVGMERRLAALRALGYSVTHTFTLHRDVVLELAKGPSS